jgi:hypothetical protein
VARVEGSRRGFLAGLLALPAVFLGAKALGALRGLGRTVRPSARGASSERCALCGSPQHSMLRCPDARAVL